MTSLEQVEEQHFGGIYRGVVVSSADPAGQQRVQVKVPAINGDGSLGWALPCVMPMDTVTITAGSPAHTHQALTVLHLPKPGEPVWVMFEHGSIDFPVYLGTWRI